MTTRAKFRCTKVQQVSTCSADGIYADKQEEVVLSAVCGKTNEQWSKWTPSGTLTMTINNPDAQGKFKPTQCYYLDITEAPEKDAQP
jgi:hypothetical protein